MMRLLRPMAAAAARYQFTMVASHCARDYNQLTDQGTRHACPQDFLPYLASEGFAENAFNPTPRPFRSCSVLRSARTFDFQLGRRWL